MTGKLDYFNTIMGRFIQMLDEKEFYKAERHEEKVFYQIKERF